VPENPRGPYRIEIMSAALKELARIPEPFQSQIRRRIDLLAINPQPGSAKPLKGSEFWRERSGHYRIIYQIKDRELLVLVIKIGKRGDVYR